MYRKNPYASNIDIKYEGGAVDMVSTYSYLLKELKMSRKFPIYLRRAVKAKADLKFNAYMYANRKEYKHMFEWGAAENSESYRLWQTVENSGLITFIYLPSKKHVPDQDEFVKYRHIFREKARVMEEAPVVVIAPDRSKYLRWRSAGEEVRSYKPILQEVAGAKYKNKFSTAFLLFWASGAGGSMQEMANDIATDPDFRFDYDNAQIQGLKRAHTMQSKKAQTGSPKVQAMAKQKMAEIEGKLRLRGAPL